MKYLDIAIYWYAIPGITIARLCFHEVFSEFVFQQYDMNNPVTETFDLAVIKIALYRYEKKLTKEINWTRL